MGLLCDLALYTCLNVKVGALLVRLLDISPVEEVVVVYHPSTKVRLQSKGVEMHFAVYLVGRSTTRTTGTSHAIEKHQHHHLGNCREEYHSRALPEDKRARKGERGGDCRNSFLPLTTYTVWLTWLNTEMWSTL